MHTISVRKVIGASVAYENERNFVCEIEAEVRVNIDCVLATPKV